jgi:hypothetical protein
MHVRAAPTLLWWAYVCVSTSDALLDSLPLFHSSAGLTPAIKAPPGGRTSQHSRHRGSATIHAEAAGGNAGPLGVAPGSSAMMRELGAATRAGADDEHSLRVQVNPSYVAVSSPCELGLRVMGHQ